jgi:predicted small secreted protein
MLAPQPTNKDNIITKIWRRGVTEAKEDDSERYIFREYFSGELSRQESQQ